MDARSTRHGGRFVELNHVIRADTVADPGPPGPTGGYAPGTELAVDDLGGITLEQTADLPAVVIRVAGASGRRIGVGALAAFDIRGAAVLLHTGDDARFGTPQYATGHHYVTADGADWLTRHGASLVGIDGVDIDDTTGPDRPVRSRLLAAGIPIVEHLVGLDQLPPTGARFTAAPLRVEAVGTIPVRAFARLPGPGGS